MQNDRRIIISTAGTRKATQWPPSKLMWSELVDRLRTPVRSTETLSEYMAMKKGQQDDLKDVGGFVAGTLDGSRRKASAVIGRDVLTLDLDNITAGGTQDVLRRVEGLNCGYCIYSTRKHSEAAPRLRVLLPLDRTCTADEYEPLARKLAGFIGIDLCDPSTFEASRLMYWPSCCSDSLYVYTYDDKPFLSVDGVLQMYGDWRNISEWPRVPGTQDSFIRLAKKQGDPTEKPGVVGAFCRIYDIYRAVNELIPGEYSPCDIAGRFTYTGGSTSGGAVVYDDGKFLYSHHATDPCGGRLVNAFDLVRLHKFSELDDDAKTDTPTNKLPSYVEMCKFAVTDVNVSMLINKERYEQAVQAFDTPLNDTNWISLLRVNPNTGAPSKEPYNVGLLFEHDPLIKGRIKKDLFADRIFGISPLPWGSRETEAGAFGWTDADDAGLRIYIQEALRFNTKDVIEIAFKNHTAKHSYNPVTDYLNALQWDGAKRLDTLFVDYLGAADTMYTRAVTRKTFTAAVARAMAPGTKFDYMTILTGAQGLGKSTMLKKMGGDWFSDSIKSFEGKEASELVQGVWVVEIGELEAFSRSEIGRIKQFLSQQEDIYRAAYGRHVEWHKRRCVFFGTSNNSEYLRDKTGNRRFWPIDVGLTPPTKNVFSDLDGEINQLWAEAVINWQLGEPLYLSGEIEKYARDEQENHRERSAREGIIVDFVDSEVPKDWHKWSLDSRRMFWNSSINNDKIKLVPRSRICALEVWCEALGGDLRSMKYTDAVEINGAIGIIDGWKRTKNGVRCGYCGLQKAFERALP